MKNILIFILFLIISNNATAIENKIIIKIENEIITTIDIENEKNYLKTLNPNINDLENNRLNLISKNSLIREKIKENEILKYVQNIKLDEEFLNRLIAERYSRLNLSNKSQFLSYLKNRNINIETIEKKISIEALWNQLIYQKFYKNIKIDKTKLKQQIKKEINKKEKNFLLSEILFKIDNKKNLDKKYLEILQFVNKESFESAALTFSISDSSSLGGKLGWIKESSLNKVINEELVNLKKGEITKPIFTPNGYLVLKIDNIELLEQKFDEEARLKELIQIKTNQQLNQQSIIYFNKVKKNTNINEL